MRAAARAFVRGRAACLRRAGRRQRLGDGLRRHQGRVPAAVRATRPPLPQRGRGAGEPDQRTAGRLDLGAAGTGPAAAVRSGGARDLHLGLPLPRAVGRGYAPDGRGSPLPRLDPRDARSGPSDIAVGIRGVGGVATTYARWHMNGLPQGIVNWQNTGAMLHTHKSTTTCLTPRTTTPYNTT